MKMRAVLVLTVLAVGFAGPAGAREPLPEVAVDLLADGFNAPVFLVAPDDGSGRRFVGEQVGQVYIIAAAGGRLEMPFLDLRDRMVTLLQAFDERGLLGMAFHPDFATNGLFYSAKLRPESPFTGETAYTRRLSEFRVSASDPNLADPASERVLLEIDWVNRKHNGGGLAFGPDGFLYLGLGDGGGVHGVPDVYIALPNDSDDPNRQIDEIPEDPFRIPERFHAYDRYAQDLSLLHGKILRIDVDHGHPGYAIPVTNPLRGSEEGRDEIYAWGFRNPFRIAFDRAGNGDLFVSGVAESFWETIYLVDGPGNYGWAIREGTRCYDRARAFDPPQQCPRDGPLGEPIQDPVIEYANWSVKRPEAKVEAEPMGTATVGGFIYRDLCSPSSTARWSSATSARSSKNPPGKCSSRLHPRHGARSGRSSA